MDSHLSAVIPDDWTLQIDCDTRKQLLYYKQRLRFVRGRLGSYGKLKSWRLYPKITRSRNGNYHVTIRSTERLTMIERICLQTLLGSDPNREMFNFFRYLNGSRFPVLFYEKRRAKS